MSMFIIVCYTINTFVLNCLEYDHINSRKNGCFMYLVFPICNNKVQQNTQFYRKILFSYTISVLLDTKEKRKIKLISHTTVAQGFWWLDIWIPFFQFCIVLMFSIITSLGTRWNETNVLYNTLQRISEYLDVFGARVSWPAAITTLLE